jgi:hypothetical protein
MAYRTSATDLHQGSMFNEIVINPTFVPEIARPFHLPGTPEYIASQSTLRQQLQGLLNIFFNNLMPPCAAPEGIINLIKCTVIANGVGYKTKRDISLVTNVAIRQPILEIPFHNSLFEILRELSRHRMREIAYQALSRLFGYGDGVT